MFYQFDEGCFFQFDEGCFQKKKRYVFLNILFKKYNQSLTKEKTLSSDQASFFWARRIPFKNSSLYSFYHSTNLTLIKFQYNGAKYSGASRQDISPQQCLIIYSRLMKGWLLCYGALFANTKKTCGCYILSLKK